MNTQKPHVIRDSKEIAAAMVKYYLRELDTLLEKPEWTDEDEERFEEIRKVVKETKHLLKG
ncbi:MAG: hypothetical protein E6Q97_07700 [Desulfurellales bacterium]|nr:MAG: hypothetical protein E6Q97_07700 [Desulfurellales bacterium]